MLKISTLVLMLVFMSMPAWGAEDTLIKLPAKAPETLTNLQPGATIILPDGRQTIIEEVMPSGEFRTQLGQIVSPSGVILSGPDQGEHIVVEGATANPNVQINIPSPSVAQTEPTQKVEVPNTIDPPIVETPKTAQEPEKVVVPEWKKRALEEKRQNPPARQDESKAKAEVPEQRATPEKSQPDKHMTIAEMLPSTKVPEKKEVKEPVKAKEAPEARKKEDPKKPEKPEAKKPEKPEAKKPEKPEPKPVKQPEPKKPYEKPKVGQEMRIPPEAAANGDLSFLNGCWQGTRPEYYSKRTIRECFCFDSNGTGKRRVIDPTGHRMCIGASKANLSKDGVLSVTSSGAACTDGQRWGSAEMVCRNSGPKTPCAWIFRDANNGRQAYTIPFVRVESCGR